MTTKRGFSLVEVLFAVLFLILVGLAMSALNSAAVKLVTAAELQTSGYALNEQTMSYINLLSRTQGPNFETNYTASCALDSTCYVSCPSNVNDPNALATNCSLSSTPARVQLGRNRLQFTPSVVMTKTGSRYIVITTASWGSGVSKQVVSSQLL